MTHPANRIRQGRGAGGTPSLPPILAAGGRQYGTELGGSIKKNTLAAVQAKRVQAPAGCQWHAARGAIKVLSTPRVGANAGKKNRVPVARCSGIRVGSKTGFLCASRKGQGRGPPAMLATRSERSEPACQPPLSCSPFFRAIWGNRGQIARGRCGTMGFRMEDICDFRLPEWKTWKTRLKPIVPQRGNPAKMEDWSACHDTRGRLPFLPGIRRGGA